MAWPKFLAESPQGCPAQNFLCGLIFIPDSLPRNEANNIFLSAKEGSFSLGAKKYVLEKFMCFFCSLSSGPEGWPLTFLGTSFLSHRVASIKRCYTRFPSVNHRGASLKVEKAHFAACEEGLKNRKNEAKLHPLGPPPSEAWLFDSRE